MLVEHGQIEMLGEVYVPTSPDGAEINAFVRQPRALRPPVGYKLEFLEQYHPNHTAYLPPGLRDQRHAVGRSPAHHTPAGTPRAVSVTAVAGVTVGVTNNSAQAKKKPRSVSEGGLYLVGRDRLENEENPLLFR